MSKEQTPIERLETLGYDPKEIVLDDDLFNEMVNKLVLEALETIQFNIEGLAYDEIYWLIETKVKPKYVKSI